MDGEILKQERFNTSREGLRGFLCGLPGGTNVALESLGFCWPWMDLIKELGCVPLLANPIKLKHRAEDVKTDRVDSELLAHLTRMDWLPTSYVPGREMHWLSSLLRHRAFRVKISTALKNRTWWSSGSETSISASTSEAEGKADCRFHRDIRGFPEPRYPRAR